MMKRKRSGRFFLGGRSFLYFTQISLSITKQIHGISLDKMF